MKIRKFSLFVQGKSFVVNAIERKIFETGKVFYELSICDKFNEILKPRDSSQNGWVHAELIIRKWSLIYFHAGENREKIHQDDDDDTTWLIALH